MKWLLAIEILAIIATIPFAVNWGSWRNLLAIVAAFVLGQSFKTLAAGDAVALSITVPLAAVGAAVCAYLWRETVRLRASSQVPT